VNITCCRVCGSAELQSVLDLGSQPWCNDYRADGGVECDSYPLSTVFCNECSTFQVGYTVPKEIMYAEHTYLSGANSSMAAHFDRVAENCINLHASNANFVVDIGSNDGTLLKSYQKKGLEVLGVEPCSSAALTANTTGITTLNRFFDSSAANEIIEASGKADIISAANVFYHVEDLHDIVDGIKLCLADDGVFVIQGTYLPTLIESNEFDIIYHEHLLYYRMGNLNYLLKLHGLELFDCDFADDVHGGSFIAYACHEGQREQSTALLQTLKTEETKGYHCIDPYLRFASRVQELRGSINGLLADLKRRGATIAAYGAPAKGTVMINYCGLDSDVISAAVEVNPKKIGTYIPGTSIKVEDEADAEEPDYYFLLSWNFLELFKRSNAFLEGKRKFIVPVPTPAIIHAGDDA